MPLLNLHGQPVGDPVHWSGAHPPAPVVLSGRHVVVRPLGLDDAPELLEVLGAHDALWTYQSTAAPRTLQDARAAVAAALESPGTVPFAITAAGTGALLGRAHLMRAQPEIGTVEVGAVVLSPALQRTTGATEAQLLLAEHVFGSLGYRRYEWKCDSLNAPSRRAALRLGFREEGTWRNALVTKGRTRDTTWFAMTDDDWPGARAALHRWLADANHDEHGRQRRSLTELRGDPA